MPKLSVDYLYDLCSTIITDNFLLKLTFLWSMTIQLVVSKKIVSKSIMFFVKLCYFFFFCTVYWSI